MPPANQADQTAVGRPAEIPGVRAIRGMGAPGDGSALFSARGPVPAAGASSVPHEHRPVFTKRPRRAPTPAFLRFGSFSRRAPRAADFGRRGDAGLRWGRAGGDGLGPSRRGRRSTAAARPVRLARRRHRPRRTVRLQSWLEDADAEHGPSRCGGSAFLRCAHAGGGRDADALRFSHGARCVAHAAAE